MKKCMQLLIAVIRQSDCKTCNHTKLIFIMIPMVKCSAFDLLWWDIASKTELHTQCLVKVLLPSELFHMLFLCCHKLQYILYDRATQCNLSLRHRKKIIHGFPKFLHIKTVCNKLNYLSFTARLYMQVFLRCLIWVKHDIATLLTMTSVAINPHFIYFFLLLHHSDYPIALPEL